MRSWRRRVLLRHAPFCKLSVTKHGESILAHVRSQGNHIFTSGATGTNAAVIRGALRAEKPELLTVVLPQSLHKQPPESQELLQEVRLLRKKEHHTCSLQSKTKC